MTRFSALSLRWLLACCLMGSMCSASSMQQIPLEGTRDLRWLRFELRLKEYRSGQARQPLNILQIGDSHTAGNILPRRLRQHLLGRQGDGGIGLLPPGMVKDHPVITARLAPSPRWVTIRDRSGARASKAGNARTLGLGGFVSYGTTPYQSIGYDLAGTPGPSRLYVYANSNSQTEKNFKLYQGTTELSPRTSPDTPGRSTFDLPAGATRLTLLSPGSSSDFQLLGLSLVPLSAQMSFSNIGVNGATFDILREWDSDVTRMELKDLAPALIILAFGTNDVVSDRFTAQRFAETLRDTEDWLHRNAPDAAVLLVMPPRAPGFGAQARQNLDTAHAVMRQAAASYHWRVWDWSQLGRDACTAPCSGNTLSALFQRDGIHLSARGYESTADLLFNAITQSADQK